MAKLKNKKFYTALIGLALMLFVALFPGAQQEAETVADVLLEFFGEDNAEALPTVAPEPPTQEAGAGLLGSGFVVLNDNPLLQGAPQGEEQQYPQGYELVSRALNADGVADPYSAHAPVLWTRSGYFVDTAAQNGQWGFKTQPVSASAGCWVVRVDGFASVVEQPEQDNLRLQAVLHVDDLVIPLGERALPQAPGQEFNEVWSVATEGGDLSVEVIAVAHYATTMPGTEVILSAVYLAQDLDSDHCQ
jgi:hypothetical protein